MTTEPRPLCEIADEIRGDWRTVNYAANPYLEALSDLNSIEEHYGLDPARAIVLYFLANSSSWRGETAKRIKAELKSIAAVKARPKRTALGHY